MSGAQFDFIILCISYDDFDFKNAGKGGISKHLLG